MTPDEKTSVRVAVRVRPLSTRERDVEYQKPCLTVATPEPQIVIGTEKAFTFDFAFPSDTEQEDVFEKTTRELVEGCFDGFNATILAYGQTGSGKTYTMGTGFDLTIPPEKCGLIPRAVDHLFQIISSKQNENADKSYDFDLWVQFIELYQDDIIDLLDRATRTAQKKRAKPPRLGEDKEGNVVLFNVCTQKVESKDEILEWLKSGALSRTTGSTNMNAQSSRSHAIFTIGIKQTMFLPDDENNPSTKQCITTFAKFHFVDLAGSERLKRTKATGDRAKESIAINSGLLALGNVICKLGDKSLKATHIPYRSSKLTRLLQDSLGGNSRTVMIACISPAESDFVETLNTLRYANRTRNIQNKLVVNQDKSSEQIAALRLRCQELEMQLFEYQQGKRQPGVEMYNDMFIENNTLQKENEKLRLRLKETSDELISSQYRNAELRAEVDRMKEMYEGGGDAIMQNLTDTEKIRVSYCQKVEELESSLRKKQIELDRAQTNSRSPPTSPLKSQSGSKTFRVTRAKQESPRSNEKLSESNISLEDSSVEDIDIALSYDEEMLDDDTDTVVSGIDEQINQKEQELNEIKNQMESEREKYESKIHELQSRIQQVETERAEYARTSKNKNENQDKIKERMERYEHELEELKGRLKSMKTLQEENKRLQKDNTTSHAKLSRLQEEIGSLKKQRVEVVKRAEKEQKLARQKEVERARIFSQKDKLSRNLLKDNTDLKLKLQQSQTIISRLRSDLQNARRANRNLFSDQVAGRVAKSNLPLEEDGMKKNWEEFLKHIHSVSFKRLRMKEQEKKLTQYNADLREYREKEAILQRKLSVIVEDTEPKGLEDVRQQLEDFQSAIHYISRQSIEIQNETASCEETTEEYNFMDPAFLRTKFPDEASHRYFLEHLIELCLTQSEAQSILEKSSVARTTELSLVSKERDVLREILHQYILDNPNQTKVDIAGVARSQIEDRGVQGLSTEEVLKNVMNTTPSRRLSTAVKARQILMKTPDQMLVPSSSSSTSSSSVNVESDSYSDGDKSPNAPAPSVPSKPFDNFAKPYLFTNRLREKQLREQHKSDQVNGTGRLREPIGAAHISVNGTAVLSTPSKMPSRSNSMNEIAERILQAKPTLAPGHSLETITAPPQSQKQAPPLAAAPVRRHPCQTHLNSISLQHSQPIRPGLSTPILRR